MTSKDFPEIVKLYNTLSLRKIAAVYKVDHKTIQRVLLNHGVKNRLRPRHHFSCKVCEKPFTSIRPNPPRLCTAHLMKYKRHQKCVVCDMNMKEFPDMIAKEDKRFCDSCYLFRSGRSVMQFNS